MTSVGIGRSLFPPSASKRPRAQASSLPPLLNNHSSPPTHADFPCDLNALLPLRSVFCFLASGIALRLFVSLRVLAFSFASNLLLLS
ncbi:hypothetical protein P154DRAFT_517592 [Amniculicola lignicola CBS 123094]|uniref:Uncharacterized protein n=1 Tax=Amniculicola lignicola CBS 123094 TaxID=1392246 RepID=A0A6A5WY38_9PLEO|nr:hypothetical protein P154DRAFT_517592 [Amniculicola lignicola CBS 123094]